MYPQAGESFLKGLRSIFYFKGLTLSEPGPTGAEQDLSALGPQPLDVGSVEHGRTAAKLNEVFLERRGRGQVQHLG